MRITSLTISNFKSFRDRENIPLDDTFTVLVGPNGGGKSNTLDILNITLRRYFLPAYTINEGEDYGLRWRDIQRNEVFSDIRRFLDPHSETPTAPSTIELEVVVGASDERNLRVITERRQDFTEILGRFRNTPFPRLSILDTWSLEGLREGTKLRYTVANHSLSPDPDNPHRVFREYLNVLHFFLLLAAEGGIEDLHPSLVYFSPYRGTSPQDLRANVSNERFFNLLAAYFNSTSQSQTSLIKLAGLFFGEKKRRLEAEARDGGYADRWDQDQDVKSISHYMRSLGYSWELELIDPNRNIYEISLQRNGSTFSVSRASSGEKEILNFLLGIFAFRTEGGLIIIDEPELHLHPRWQATLRDLLVHLATTTHNQIVLSTHSPVFITPDTIANVRRVARDHTGTTKVIRPSGEDQHRRDLLHILNSHNNERIFFADKVLLVEGIQDRLVFERLIDLFRRAANLTDVIEVVEVHGKGNFAKYRELLSAVDIPKCIVADLDYAATLRPQQLGELLAVDWRALEDSVFKTKKSSDRSTLAEMLEEALRDANLDQLGAFWSYLKARASTLPPDLSSDKRDILDKALAELAAEGIFILPRGEIEAYLPAGRTTLDATIELLKPTEFRDWIGPNLDDTALAELETICLRIMGIDEGNFTSIRKVARSLPVSSLQTTL